MAATTAAPAAGAKDKAAKKKGSTKRATEHAGEADAPPAAKRNKTRAKPSDAAEPQSDVEEPPNDAGADAMQTSDAEPEAPAGTAAPSDAFESLPLTPQTQS
ncbi:hypothetical protein H4R21_002843, partial [Coemansia helicoidea]